jgi:hypothetical protein
MVVFAPLVFYVIKRYCFPALVLLSALYLCGIWPSELPVFWEGSLFYFSVGAAFSIHGKNMVELFWREKWFCGAAMLVFLVLAIYNFDGRSGGSYSQLYRLFAVVSFVNLVSFCVRNFNVEKILLLGKTSFFVFAAHAWLPLLLPRRILERSLGNWGFGILGKLFRYFALPFLCVLICLCLYYLLKKIAPRLLKVLIGAR